MSYQHKDLASGRWGKMSFVEQMANIGSEVERSINWRVKNNSDYSQRAFERALELIDMTLLSVKASGSAGLRPGGVFARLKEIARAREAIVDYFFGSNEFMSSDKLWRSYFSSFAYAARNK